LAIPFSRTTRSLARDTPAVAMLLWGCAVLLLAVWLAWFVGGRVTVYEVSRTARLEVQQAAFPVVTSVAGRVLSNHMVLGQEVHAGDVLATLDLRREALRVGEENTRLAAIEPQLDSLQREIAAQERAQAQDNAAAEAALRAARARLREAVAAVDFAKDNERRLRDESRVGGVSQLEALRAGAEVQKLSAVRDALAADAERIQGDARTRRSQQQVVLEGMHRNVQQLQGNRSTSQSTLERLSHEMEPFVLKAAVDGVIGEVLPLGTGSFLGEGQKLATIVPHGNMRVVADFAPGAAFGRLHAGQKGSMRMDGFPWTEFGSVAVEVRVVAAEAPDRSVRVELTPRTNPASRIPMQHGMPGTVEISLEQITPAQLLLRAIGQVSGEGMLAATRAESSKP